MFQLNSPTVLINQDTRYGCNISPNIIIKSEEPPFCRGLMYYTYVYNNDYFSYTNKLADRKSCKIEFTFYITKPANTNYRFFNKIALPQVFTFEILYECKPSNINITPTSSIT